MLTPGMKRTGWLRHVKRGVRAEGGQALVEFALVLPTFMLLILGAIEFSYLLNSRNTVTSATRQAAMRAAEGGSRLGTDCVVLESLEAGIISPAKSILVSQVLVFWSDANGNQMGDNSNTYTRGGSMTCDYGDGTSLTVPYTLTSEEYPPDERCDVLAGCGGPHPVLDTVAVQVTYQHSWLTSFARITGDGGLTFSTNTAARIEPQK